MHKLVVTHITHWMKHPGEKWGILVLHCPTILFFIIIIINILVGFYLLQSYFLYLQYPHTGILPNTHIFRFSEGLSEKDKCIRIGNNPCRIMRVKGVRLEQVENCKDLGAFLNENGYIDEEIRKRAGAAGWMFSSIRKGFLNDEEVTKKTKMGKLMFFHILSYSSESWPITLK